METRLLNFLGPGNTSFKVLYISNTLTKHDSQVASPWSYKLVQKDGKGEQNILKNVARFIFERLYPVYASHVDPSALAFVVHHTDTHVGLLFTSRFFAYFINKKCPRSSLTQALRSVGRTFVYSVSDDRGSLENLLLKFF